MFIVERTLPCSEEGCSERRMVNANGGVFPRCEMHQRAFWAMAAALRKNTRALPRKEVIKKDGEVTVMPNQSQIAAVERSLYEKLVQLAQGGDKHINLNSLKGMLNRGYITDMGAPVITEQGYEFMRQYAERNQLDLPEHVIEVEPGRVERENGTVYHEVVTEFPVAEIMNGAHGREDVPTVSPPPTPPQTWGGEENGHECGACDQCDYRAVVEMIAQTRPEVRELVETMARARRLRQALKL